MYNVNQPMVNFQQQDHVLFQQPITTQQQAHPTQHQQHQNKSNILNSTMYLIKKPPPESTLTGSTNLLQHFGLDASYNKFLSGKKMKENLSSFLPDLPGCIDTVSMEDGSSLQAIIAKPPITSGKEIQPLSQTLLSSFRLHPGPIPERYMALHHPVDTRRKSKHKNKHKLDMSLEGDDLEHRKFKKKKHEDGERKKKKKEKKKKREGKKM